MASSHRLTVGVVIDLPEPHATVIDRWRGRSGDAQAGRIAPHITVLPPTVIEALELQEVLEHLDKVAAATSAFPLDLTGTGSFRPVSQVAFVRVGAGAGQCAELEAAVRSGPLGHPREYPYSPHVTIAHDVDDPALDEACAVLSDFVARFPVDRFSLYLLDNGSWSFERQFVLASPASASAPSC